MLAQDAHVVTKRFFNGALWAVQLVPELDCATVQAVFQAGLEFVAFAVLKNAQAQAEFFGNLQSAIGPCAGVDCFGVLQLHLAVLQALGTAKADIGLGLDGRGHFQHGVGCRLGDVGKVVFNELGKLSLCHLLGVVALPFVKLGGELCQELGPVIAPAW